MERVRRVVRDEVKDNRSGGGQMLQGMEDHLEGFSFTLREMENHWELSQGKSRADSLRDENRLVEHGVETMR